MTNLTLATALTAAIALGTPILAGEFDPAAPVAMPAAQLVYFNLNPAIRMADAYGELAKGAHGTFGKFPANFDSGLHTHTGPITALSCKG